MDPQVIWDLLWQSLQGGNYDIESLQTHVRDDSHFVDEMGIDSLDLVEFYLRLEEHVHVNLEADDYSNLTSVQAIMTFLQEQSRA
jgi:acyl carrier protein